MELDSVENLKLDSEKKGVGSLDHNGIDNLAYNKDMCFCEVISDCKKTDMSDCNIDMFLC